jgi:hypothetical protein
MIRSAEPDDTWWWCYVDDRLYEHGAPVTPLEEVTRSRATGGSR